MNYIVCRNCKRVIEVKENTPLVFDKCENCGHTLEFAADNRDLQFILNDVEVPKIAYHKICAKCKSLNPRETGACLFCGSTSFKYQYDLDSLNKYKNSLNLNQMQMTNMSDNYQQSISNNWLYRILALILGIIDFFFVVMIGLGLIIGDGPLPTDSMTFIMQHLNMMMIVLIVALFVSGFLSIFILPKMKYKDSFMLSGLLGLIIGLITIITTTDILVIIPSMVLCAIITGIGGLVAQFIVHKIIGRFFGR